MITFKVFKRWHIQEADNRNRDKPNGVRTTKPLYRHWQFARTAAQCTFITPFALIAVTIAANWQSKKKMQPPKTLKKFKNRSLKRNGFFYDKFIINLYLCIIKLVVSSE